MAKLDGYVLVGSSTAGKSSIISELLKQKKEFVEHGGDLAGVKIPLAYAEKHHSEEMAFIRKVIQPTEKLEKNPDMILDYFLGEPPIFKEGVTPDEKALFFKITSQVKDSLFQNVPPDQISNLMMDEILVTAKSGRPVVFDLLHIKEIFDHALSKEPPPQTIKYALVYCPFQILAQRIISRNEAAVESGNLHDARPGVFPLEQFTKLFRPKREEQEATIQKITRKEAEESFDLAFEDGVKFLEKYDPHQLENRDIQKDKAEQKAKILKKLGFAIEDSPDKIVELTPRFNGYHILINTARTDRSKDKSVQESVKDILFKTS